MNKRRITRKEVSLAVARLMPQILRGVQLDFFLQRGVTQTQFLVLAAVRAFARCPMGMLARSLHVALPTATGLVGRLVRAGLVRRAPHPEDRRQVIVSLTAKGQAFFQDFERVIRRRWEEVLLALDAQELAAFHDVLTKLRERLQAAG